MVSKFGAGVVGGSRICLAGRCWCAHCRSSKARQKDSIDNPATTRHYTWCDNSCSANRHDEAAMFPGLWASRSASHRLAWHSAGHLAVIHGPCCSPGAAHLMRYAFAFFPHESTQKITTTITILDDCWRAFPFVYCCLELPRVRRKWPWTRRGSAKSPLRTASKLSVGFAHSTIPRKKPDLSLLSSFLLVAKKIVSPSGWVIYVSNEVLLRLFYHNNNIVFLIFITIHYWLKFLLFFRLFIFFYFLLLVQFPPVFLVLYFDYFIYCF